MRSLGPNVPPGILTMHPGDLIAHASTVTAWVIWQKIVEAPACPRLNRAQGLRGKRLNQVVANNEGHGRGNQENQARGRAFMLGAEEARQDLNIVTGTFTLNDHYATTLFDSGVDYSFVSTTFIPLLGIDPSELDFRYEIEIASGQLVEIDKVIKGCRLEIKGRVFDIDLIPFGHGSFDVIIGAMPMAKSPYHLAPFELEELSRQLKKLQDKELNKLTIKNRYPLPRIDDLFDQLHVINGNGLHVDPSKIEAVKNWKAPRTPNKELAFQTLKDKLCNAPVLALHDGPKDFVVYCDTPGIGLGCVLMKRGKSSIKDRILVAQKEAVDEFARLQRGLDEMIKQRSAETLYYLDRIWVPLKREVRTLIMDEAHKSKYSIHPGADKMYYDLRDSYWWPGMKKDIAEYDYKMDRLARLYLNEIVARHGVPILIISDHDSRFIKALPVNARGIRNSFRHEYGLSPSNQWSEKCRSPIMWAKVGEGQLIGPELVQETSEKISQIKDRLKAARDRQKSYADKKRKPLEFSVGDYVLLKVSPWKGVVRFGKKGKLAPRFVRPFEIIKKVGPVAYRLDLLKELNDVHDTFHVSNLKKCLADLTLQVPLDEIRVDAKLNFIEEHKSRTCRCKSEPSLKDFHLLWMQRRPQKEALNPSVDIKMIIGD
nr:putative reverse transcriptase domain-containing protein [Tanacetum cinerariifolium]